MVYSRALLSVVISRRKILVNNPRLNELKLNIEQTVANIDLETL
jgi:hypothetical protein